MTVSTVETELPRHFLGRVHRGRNLREALAELAREHRLTTAWITAIGAFEWVTLTDYSQKKRAYEPEHRVRACEVLSMQGTLSMRDGEPFWQLHATVSVGAPTRRVHAGHVVDASVFALEFRVAAFDDLALSRTVDDATGLELWDLESSSAGTAATFDEPAPDPGPAPGASADGAVTWAMAAQASVEATKPTPVAHRPVKGEWIDHPKFGVCKVEGMSGEGVAIVKLPDARRKKIQLGIFDVFEPRDDGSRKIYPVRKKQ
ncbi:MAG: PPC domain-containing DNA-binding protein [Myxococcota bacterium]